MARIRFLQPDGRSETFTAQAGDTVLDVALDNNVAGIVGQCGGGMTCCSCHCWVQDDRLGAPDADELELLEYAWGRNDDSRLACQLDALDDLTVRVPEKQSI